MKTFKDLEFKPHPMFPGLQAIMFFDNGYGVSVVRFRLSGLMAGSYTNGDDDWELAVIKGSPEDWDIVPSTDRFDNPVGYLLEHEVTEKMKQVQELK